MSENKKLPIDVLLNHLKEFKDAVIVLGPDVLEETKQFNITQETYEFYNRKKMIKEPSAYWTYYANNIMNPLAISNKTTIQLNKLLNMNLHSSIIDTNIVKVTSREELISPNGKNDVLECVKCHKKYDANKMFNQLLDQNEVLKCECGGNIKPTVLYYGEKYNSNMYNSVKNAIFTEENGVPELKTHTLIFIGCDFTDTLVSELIDSYDALKKGKFLTVIITDKNNRDDLIYYNPEFGVTDDLDQALDRLIGLINK